MTRGTKTALAVLGLMLVASFPTALGFVRAYYERSKISPGMDANGVFIVADEWNLCISSSRDKDTQQFQVLNIVKDPGGQVYRVPKYDKTFGSKGEFLDFLEQEMGKGKTWNSQLTYFAGPVRNTYRIDFDASGKVTHVSAMVGGP